MIHPTFQITAELYIHAARAAVWARFCRVTEWPRWRADVAQVTWIHGHTWQEGAQFTVSATTPNAVPETFTIRMVVPDDTTVWENSSAGQGLVYSLHLTDQVGGSKVSCRCTFHGWGSLLKRMNAGAEKARLDSFLTALKETIEGDRSRG